MRPGLLRAASRLVLVAGLVGASASVAARAQTAPVPGTGVLFGDSQPDYSWNAGYRSVAVKFPSRRSGAALAGTLYGPADLDQLGALPAVVVIPPSGGFATQGNVSYLAKFLAVNGFLGLTVDPQGVGGSESLGDPPCTGAPGRSNPDPCPNLPYQQMDNFLDAGRSALDFLLGGSDPWSAHVDAAHVGATGHSEGARAASYLQDPAFDGRVSAVVALDNLTSNYCGDAGTPSREGPGGATGVANAVINGQPGCPADPSNPAFAVHPVGPAMGLASDGAGGFGRDAPGTGGPPDEKKAAYEVWRSAGVASMELVLAGVNHNQFSQSGLGNEAMLHRIAVYTEAWFARFLKGDTQAVGTLLSRTTLGEPVEQFLSASYRSAAFLPADRVDCEDFRAGCAPLPGRHGRPRAPRPAA